MSGDPKGGIVPGMRRPCFHIPVTVDDYTAYDASERIQRAGVHNPAEKVCKTIMSGQAGRRLRPRHPYAVRGGPLAGRPKGAGADSRHARVSPCSRLDLNGYELPLLSTSMHQSLFYGPSEPPDDDAGWLTADAERQQDMLNQARAAALEPWDFAALEMMRREDMAAPMKVGTMRFTRSMLRLYAHGLVAKLDREPTFDERERINAFRKSPRFKSYAGNVKDTATKDDRRYFEDVGVDPLFWYHFLLQNPNDSCPHLFVISHSSTNSAGVMYPIEECIRSLL